MESNDPQEAAGVPFAGEYLKRYKASMAKMREVKDWRTREFEAGRPSSLADYYRTSGLCLCPGCHGIGISLNENGMGFKAVGWDQGTQLFERCGICDGTGNPKAIS